MREHWNAGTINSAIRRECINHRNVESNFDATSWGRLEKSCTRIVVSRCQRRLCANRNSGRRYVRYMLYFRVIGRSVYFCRQSRGKVLGEWVVVCFYSDRENLVARRSGCNFRNFFPSTLEKTFEAVRFLLILYRSGFSRIFSRNSFLVFFFLSFYATPSLEILLSDTRIIRFEKETTHQRRYFVFAINEELKLDAFLFYVYEGDVKSPCTHAVNVALTRIQHPSDILFLGCWLRDYDFQLLFR